LLLASTSPQRRAILEQLDLPFEVTAPYYVEHDPPDLPAVALVRNHALGKARSVLAGALDRPVLAVDTTVALDGRTFGKPLDPAEAATMLESLSNRTHEVVSGLCLIAGGQERVEHEITCVTFRALTRFEIEHYVETAEWQGRAGGYAIQGRGAALVSRIEGDYLNVVGLPGALLVKILGEEFPGVYGFGEPVAGPLERSTTLGRG
jgi:nucleoside triphosphate pyrophosphatase